MHNDHRAGSNVALNERVAIQHHLQPTDDPVIIANPFEFRSEFEHSPLPGIEHLSDFLLAFQKVLGLQPLSRCWIEGQGESNAFAEPLHGIEGLARQTASSGGKETSRSQTHKHGYCGQGQSCADQGPDLKAARQRPKPSERGWPAPLAMRGRCPGSIQHSQAVGVDGGWIWTWRRDSLHTRGQAQQWPQFLSVLRIASQAVCQAGSYPQQVQAIIQCGIELTAHNSALSLRLDAMKPMHGAATI
jgi:hypothetical protein